MSNIELINQTAEKVRSCLTPASFEIFCQKNIGDCELAWDTRGSGYIRLAVGGDIYDVYVFWNNSPRERLVTFFHEVLHLVFAWQEVPLIDGAGTLNNEELEHLEKILDQLSEEFLDLNPTWAENFFERYFKWRCDDFCAF